MFSSIYICWYINMYFFNIQYIYISIPVFIFIPAWLVLFWVSFIRKYPKDKYSNKILMKLRIDIHTLKSSCCTESYIMHQSALAVKQLSAEVKHTDADLHLDITLDVTWFCRLNAPQPGWGMTMTAVSAAGFRLKIALQSNKKKKKTTYKPVCVCVSVLHSSSSVNRQENV